MADNTDIEWTDATWNPITGCSVVSPGCTNCYAMGLAGTRLKHSPSRQGLTTPSKAGPVWNGQVRLNEQWLDQPLHWKRPRRIFVCAHGDLFHENVPDEWIDRVFAVMALAPQHTFQVLTKRAARMREYFSGIPDCPGEPAARDALIEGSAQLLHHQRTGEDPSLWLAVHMPMPNVWLGVSAERQREADERIHDLRATPAAVRFVSLEPLLGPIDLRRLNNCDTVASDALSGLRVKSRTGRPIAGDLPWNQINWVIAGGESGRNARPAHPDWFRSLRDQCQAAGVPFFFKQWGEWLEWRATGADRWSNASKMDRNGFTKRSLGTLHGPAGPLFGGHAMPTHHAADGTTLVRVGKKRAGALLDGREWREMPE